MRLFKWNPKKELILVAVSLLWAWYAYYGDSQIIGLFSVIVVCVCFPAWWIIKVKKEGFAALGITSNNLLLSIIFTLGLSIWRGTELIHYICNGNLPTTLIFNCISIWEVFYLFSWLYTRYEASFGKVPAILLTTISTGLYHIGTLPIKNILYLCFCVCIITICFSVTKNIFTLWPIYWTVGCSASTLKNSMSFSWIEIGIFAVILIIQIGYLFFLKYSNTRIPTVRVE